MIIHLIVVDSDPALREFDDIHIDSFCQRFRITQSIEVNLDAPDAILLDQFLVNLVKEFYEKDVKLPADSLRSDFKNDEEDSQIVKEDNTKCCIM